MSPPGRGPGRPRFIEGVFLALGLALVLRYRWILDDAFVYFRYADNVLFLGRGLVYNDGEYVEGYTSPLWMLATILLRTTRLDWWTLATLGGVVAFAVFGLLLVRLGRITAPAGPVANVPLAYLSLCYGASCYFTSGLETPLAQVGAVAFALLVHRPASRASQLATGAMPLVRPELLLVVPIGAAWAWRRTGRVPWALLASAVILAGGWLGFRMVYYADLLPNTFHLKDEVAVRQGVVYLMQTASTYRLPGMLALLGALSAALALRPREGFEARWAERGVLLLAALVVAAYVVKIGGDFRHWRMLAFPLVLAVCAVAGLAEEAVLRAGPARARRLAPAAAVAAGAIAFAGVPPQLERHPVTLREGHRIVDGIGDASWDRHERSLEFSKRRARADRELRAAYARAGGGGHQGTITTSLCVDGFFAFRYRVVNSLGLTDAFLARTDARTDWAGHKYRLHACAQDLVTLQQQRGPVGRGTFRALAAEGGAPKWVRDNVGSLEVVAAKVYNRHDLRENLSLAFTFPERIRIGGREAVPPDR
jgi:hypothetical protein